MEGDVHWDFSSEQIISYHITEYQSRSDLREHGIQPYAFPPKNPEGRREAQGLTEMASMVEEMLLKFPILL